MVCIHVHAHVCMCRGQKPILTVFLYCSLPYSLGTELFSELEAVWLDTPFTTLKFCGYRCASHTWLCRGLSVRDTVLSPTEPFSSPS